MVVVVTKGVSPPGFTKFCSVCDVNRVRAGVVFPFVGGGWYYHFSWLGVGVFVLRGA